MKRFVAVALLVAGCASEPVDRTVNGLVVDEGGAALIDALVTVCGRICYRGVTDTKGAFRVPIAKDSDASQLAVCIHGRPDRVTYYVPVDASQSAAERIDFATPFVAPAIAAGGPLVALDKSAQTITAGDVTLHIAEGTKINLDVEDDTLGERGRELRAIAYDDLSTAPFPIDETAGLEVLYFVTPFEATYKPGITITLANRRAWPAGTEVDVMMMRGLTGTTVWPAGVFEKVSSAKVSADGARITLDANATLSTITWLALKRR